MSATLVDVGALWQTVWSAMLAGLLVTLACAVAVLGAARAQEHRGAPLGTRWAAVGALGGLGLVAVLLYGLLLVVD